MAKPAEIPSVRNGTDADKTGANIAVSSSKTITKIAPKIAPTMLPKPPMMSIPKYHMDCLSVKRS